MPILDERHVLHIGPPRRLGETEVTPEMVEAVTARVRDAGVLGVYAVLREDVYDRGDGSDEFLSLRGVAFRSIEAYALVERAGKDEGIKWYVKPYQLALEDGILAPYRPWVDDISINELVAMVAEIPPGGKASKLHTGTGRRKDGPFVELPDK